MDCWENLPKSTLALTYTKGEVLYAELSGAGTNGLFGQSQRNETAQGVCLAHAAVLTGSHYKFVLANSGSNGILSGCFGQWRWFDGHLDKAFICPAIIPAVLFGGEFRLELLLYFQIF